MEQDFFYLKQSNKTFDQALVDLQKSIENHGFSVLQVLNMQERYLAIGKESKPISKVQLCNAEMSHHAISIDKKLISLMPKDISIYVDDNDTVNMVFMKVNPDFLANAFPEANMQAMSAKVGGILKQIIDDAV